MDAESPDDVAKANKTTLIMFGLIMAVYAGCLQCNIHFTNHIVSAVIAFTVWVLPLAAISMVLASKTNFVNKFFTSLAFVILSLIVVVVAMVHTLGMNQPPYLSQRIDSRNDVVVYRFYPLQILSGGDFDVGRPLHVQVVQQQHLFPGIVRQYKLLEETRDDVSITALGDHRISCRFPAYYYSSLASPNDSFPLTCDVHLKH